jgi:AcrR family transcriptional regulator
VLVDAIHAATLEELSETGYAGLSVERVAKRARTSKAAIYRRWPARADLVAAAIRHGVEHDQQMAPDTGDVRADLFAVLRRAADLLAGPLGEAARGLLTEALADPEKTKAVRERVVRGREQVIATVLERGVRRGEVGPQALTAQVISVPPTMLSQHFLIYGTPIEDAVINEILDRVVMPLIRP